MYAQDPFYAPYHISVPYMPLLKENEAHNTVPLILKKQKSLELCQLANSWNFAMFLACWDPTWEAGVPLEISKLYSKQITPGQQQ